MKDKASQTPVPQTTRINQSTKSSFSDKPSTPSVSKSKSRSANKIPSGLPWFPYLLMGLEIGLVALGEVFHDKWLVHYAAQGLIFWIRKFTPPIHEPDIKVVRHKRRQRRKK